MRALLVVVLAGCASHPVVTPPTPRPPSTLAQLDASRDLDGHVIGASDAPTVVIVMASWCAACRDELAMFDRLRATHPRVRWLGVNYKQHEEYNGRGDSESMRAFARDVPWLRVVPAGEALYTAVGRPPKIPTVLVFRGGELVARFDRSQRKAPTQDELEALLR
jgi:thiol-disulfide isomerase/thioredoxin